MAFTESAETAGGVAIIGAGTMGAGMAVAFARFGWTVRLVSRRESTIEAAFVHMREKVALLAACDVIPTSAQQTIMARIRAGTDLQDVASGTRLVVESIVEDLSAKSALLSELENVIGRDCVLSSNTSSLPLGELSAALRYPERFAGFHWFNPAELVPLVEVIPVSATADAVVADLVNWSYSLGKEPVVVRREIPGFVANRLQYALIREAYWLVEQNVCTTEDVDRVLRHGLGLRWASMGPFESVDFAGLDVHLKVAGTLFPLLSCSENAPSALQTAVASGALGVKSGRGLRGTYEPDAVSRRRADQARTLAALEQLVRGDS